MFREIQSLGNIPVVLVGNKIDLKSERKVPIEKITFHRIKDVPYHEISVKEEIRLEKPIISLISIILNRDDVRLIQPPAPSPPLLEFDWREAERIAILAAENALPEVPDDDGDSVS